MAAIQGSSWEAPRLRNVWAARVASASSETSELLSFTNNEAPSTKRERRFNSNTEKLKETLFTHTLDTQVSYSCCRLGADTQLSRSTPAVDLSCASPPSGMLASYPQRLRKERQKPEKKTLSTIVRVHTVANVGCTQRGKNVEGRWEETLTVVLLRLF